MQLALASSQPIRLVEARHDGSRQGSTFWVRGAVARRVCTSVNPSAEAAQWLSKDTRLPARVSCSSATTTHQLGF